eukprot:TRINITY_DN27181_c0_g1_i1.p1 TRINITY_DN27181_c0_g1~~TRINITY_DN27181_c0_g1_i1.p1  ORF type:complete len:582 (+),score=224.11 TRINITY_DN27181_c0_g1_i1:79-1824(+)
MAGSEAGSKLSSVTAQDSPIAAAADAAAVAARPASRQNSQASLKAAAPAPSETATPAAAPAEKQDSGLKPPPKGVSRHPSTVSGLHAPTVAEVQPSLTRQGSQRSRLAAPDAASVQAPQGSAVGSRKGSRASLHAEPAPQTSFAAPTAVEPLADVEAVAKEALAAAEEAMSGTLSGSRRMSQASLGVSQRRPPTDVAAAEEVAEEAAGPGTPAAEAPAASEHESAAQPAIEIDTNDPAALRATIVQLRELLQRKDQDLRDKVAHIRELRDQLSDGGRDQDARVKRLSDDLKDRDGTIKRLQGEVADLSKKAQSAEKDKKDAQRLSRRMSTCSTADAKAVQERDRTIKELQEQLERREDELDAARKAAAGARDSEQAVRGLLEQTRAAAAAAGVEVSGLQTLPMAGNRASIGAPRSGDGAEATALRQQLAQREAEVKQLLLRLDRAQDAIICTAGSGFENEVKLQQARSALRCILTAQRSTSASPPPGASAAAALLEGASPQSVGSAPVSPPEVGAASCWRSRTDFRSPLGTPPYHAPPRLPGSLSPEYGASGQSYGSMLRRSPQAPPHRVSPPRMPTGRIQ